MAIGVGVSIVRAIISFLGRKLDIHWHISGQLQARILFLLVTFLVIYPYSIRTLETFTSALVVSLFWSWISGNVALMWADWWDQSENKWYCRDAPVYIVIIGVIVILLFFPFQASAETRTFIVLLASVVIAVPLASLAFIKADQPLMANPVLTTMAAYSVCLLPIVVLLALVLKVQDSQVASLWVGWMLGGCAAAIFGFSQLQDLVFPRLVNELK
jgi:hypothetical protein